MKKILAVFLFIVILSGCAGFTTTDTYSDGRKSTTTAYEIGRTEMISNFVDSHTKESRTISVGSSKADVNVEALKVSTAGLGKIVGTAARAAAGLPPSP